jgi:hypothetical protein
MLTLITDLNLMLKEKAQMVVAYSFILCTCSIPSLGVTSTTAESYVCENIIIDADFEQKFQEIQNNLEEDFNQGAPKKIKGELLEVRGKIDQLTLNVFDLKKPDSQEFHHFANQTLQALDQLIELMPRASAIAPKMRVQYVVPFANISSLKADYYDCMMRAAIEQAQEEIQTSGEIEVQNEDRSQTYKKLSKELNDLNKNLYHLETADLQKLISYRAQIINEIERFNQQGQPESYDFTIAQEFPELLNSVHNEIEKVLPGLQLSKNYYSLK